MSYRQVLSSHLHILLKGTCSLTGQVNKANNLNTNNLKIPKKHCGLHKIPSHVACKLHVWYPCTRMINWAFWSNRDTASRPIATSLTLCELGCDIFVLWNQPKTSSCQLPYQHPSSSADCARELFKASNRSDSLLVCTQKKFFGWGLRIFWVTS